MQTLEIISVNFWQILISLCNLLLLYFILRFFLYKPVQRLFAEREGTIAARYDRAETAEAEAERLRRQWEEKMARADGRVEAIARKAASDAKSRTEKLLSEAQSRAGLIRRQAEEEAVRERVRAEEQMKRDIVEISAALSEKLLRRELSPEDHRRLIDDFISRIGDEDAGER